MKLLLLFTLFFCATAEKYEGDELFMAAINVVDRCGSRGLSLCLKENVWRYVEHLPNTLDFGSGWHIKPNTERIPRNYQPVTLPEEEIARENLLDNILIERILDYVTSHVLEFKIEKNDLKDIDEARKKKKKNMMPLWMLFQLKAAVLGALALKFIGLVAFKALLVAKIALIVASIIALKKIVEQKAHTSTYEVYAHPHYDEHNYDRSFTKQS